MPSNDGIGYTPLERILLKVLKNALTRLERDTRTKTTDSRAMVEELRCAVDIAEAGVTLNESSPRGGSKIDF